MASDATHNDHRPVVLIFVSTYLPGYKAGGPIRSIANIVRNLGNDINFKIVTSDRDLLDIRAYPDVIVGEWNHSANADVYYASRRDLTLRFVLRLLKETRFDILYLNSFFDFRFSTLPLIVWRVAGAPGRLILAPRGEFSPGALHLKARKKRLFLAISRILHLHSGLTWHASTRDEAVNIEKGMVGQAKEIVVAPNVPGERVDVRTGPSRSFPLRIAFVSRISPKKNLDFALSILSKLSISVQFTIIGPATDETYWSQCQRLIKKMPENVQIEIGGSVDHERLPALLSQQDLLFLPTKGENYGHIIIESLSVGTPILISDQTPWRKLKEQGVGWDLPLAAEARYVAAIEEAAAKGEGDYAEWRKRVIDFAGQCFDRSSLIQANRDLFSNVGHTYRRYSDITGV